MGRALPSNVVVHRELVRVRSQAKRVVFFLFHVHPAGDEIFVEDVAAQQERVIGLERFDRATERIRGAFLSDSRNMLESESPRSGFAPNTQGWPVLRTLAQDA